MSYDFAKDCKPASVEHSMGWVGDCYESAMVERFFATLECDLIDRSVFENRNEARMAIFGFIEDFYNSWRRHSSIGNVCPAEYERRRRAQRFEQRCMTGRTGVRQTRVTPSLTQSARSHGVQDWKVFSD